jgi:KilA-N domain
MFDSFKLNVLKMNIPVNYKNLTNIAKASQVQLNNWLGRSVGKQAIFEFRHTHPGILNPIIVVKGRSVDRGTWAHPELAAVFAAWCNPSFTAQVVEQNAQILEQNAELKDWNALLQEKIRTFQVNTPAQIEAARDEAEEVKSLAHRGGKKTEAEMELIAKCHFVRAIGSHPKGLTFEQYLPHWLWSVRNQAAFKGEVIDAMVEKSEHPVPIQGKVLKEGCTYVWV